jgi:outer membrane scaffolding protein for murein synthesis (MipA/OmpV family)
MSNTLAEIKNVTKSCHWNASFAIAFNLFQECQMRFVAFIFVLSLIFTSSIEAQQVPSQPADWSGSSGGAVIAFPKYPGSDEYWVLPVPLLNVEYKGRIFLGPASSGAAGALGAYVVRTPSWSWAVTMGVTDARPESRGDALAGMGDRGIGLNAGTSFSYRRGMLQTSGVVTFGLNDTQGWTGTLSAGLGGRLGDQWFASLDANATFADTDQMQYHFGIDASQALRRHALIAAHNPKLGLDEGGPYSADAGLQSVGLNGSFGYVLSHRWTALGFLSMNRLEGDAAQSPLVRQRESFVTGLGLSYWW